jgi:hypothetical protein
MPGLHEYTRTVLSDAPIAWEDMRTVFIGRSLKVLQGVCETLGVTALSQASAGDGLLFLFGPLGNLQLRLSLAILKRPMHTVRVEADSVYEAACLAIRALKKAAFINQQPGPASRLEVEVSHGVVTHAVTVAQVQRWLALGSTNPNEEAKRRRLREVLRVK